MQQLDPEPPEVADAELVRSVIQRVATGPELSKNISLAEARSITRALVDGSVDPVQAAVILIGLRMKRETDDEVRGVLDGLRDATINHTTALDDVVAMAEPYNGFNRTLQGSLFALPVLAACNCPTYSHGVELCGPKYGVTHHSIFRALGGNPMASVEAVGKRLADPAIGWGYIDQSVFCPGLFGLNELRSRIVKRPVLSTTEVLLAPLLGKKQTHLVTGYVHKPYRDTYAMLARHAGFASLLLVRGTEGGVIPSFRGRAHVVRYHARDTGVDGSEELDIDLAAINMDREYRAEDIPESMPLANSNPVQVEHERAGRRIGMKWDVQPLAQLCADKGVAALNGEPGAMRDAAVFGAAMTLWHLGQQPDMTAAVAAANAAIDSGAALQRLEAGL